VSFKICWLSLSPNCIVLLLLALSIQQSGRDHLFPHRKGREGRKGEKIAHREQQFSTPSGLNPSRLNPCAFRCALCVLRGSWFG
jgi:hypothetical protein